MSSDLLPTVRAQSGALNLSALQRTDPHISRLLHTGKHVVLYQLDQNNNTWTRLEIEGNTQATHPPTTHTIMQIQL